MKGCICHFTKWQIHLFISKGANYVFVQIVHNYVGNFYPLEVVDRGSETQPQVDENLNSIS